MMKSEQRYALYRVMGAAENRADAETHECNDLCESGDCPLTDSNAQACLDEAVEKLVATFMD